MARIAQQRFPWEEIEALGDLERLQLLLDHLPDAELVRQLERRRGRGRNDYPVRAVWNSLLAGVVFQHPSIASLRRELGRNAQLRRLCGLDRVPPACVYSRLQRQLQQNPQLSAMFVELTRQLGQLLPDFGQCLAMDGKALASYAQPPAKEAAAKPADGRRETEAEWGVKSYKSQLPTGEVREHKVSWFGFRLHLLVDAKYELPLAYLVTPAANSEVKCAHQLLDELKAEQPWLLERAERWLGDRAYDDSKLLIRLWDDHQIKPVIGIRNCWQDGEATRLLPGQENVVYDYQGTVYCHCPVSGIRRTMAYGGFEQDRNTLKYRCPAQHYGLECKGMQACPVGQALRIPLATDRRIFVPIARSSYKWERAYAQRTAVERVNSRLDRVFGFEEHFIRGLKKMQLRCTLALSVMLAMALGRVRTQRMDRLRSLVAA